MGEAIVPDPPAGSKDKSNEVEPPNWAAGTGLASIMDDEIAITSNIGEYMIDEVLISENWQVSGYWGFIARVYIHNYICIWIFPGLSS